jgi:serine O-acetyltransferase
LRRDIERYKAVTGQSWLAALLTNQGLWVSCQYRISCWVHHHVHLPVVRPLLKVTCFVWRKLIEVTTHCEMPNRAIIGPGLYLSHAYGIVIHTEARIGEYCNIGHLVTIGVNARPDRRGAPSLGDRVFVGPGAVLLGPIRVGSDVAIGANAVVLKDLPDQVLAVGVPARIVSLRDSTGLLDPSEPDRAGTWDGSGSHSGIPMEHSL